MNRENRCQYCGNHLVKCRNPNQHYCHKYDCQRQRKNLWRRNKLDADSDYKSNQNAANRRWRESHKTYWQNYRAKHPNYVVRNREKQRVRDQKNKESHLAKSDTSTPKNIITSGSYYLMPAIEPYLAKSDALIVKITLITDTSAVATASG
jgi:hypothetical protein